jgi:hypothetical protein
MAAALVRVECRSERASSAVSALREAHWNQYFPLRAGARQKTNTALGYAWGYS